MRKKFLALLLALVMLLSLVPVAAFAAEGDTGSDTKAENGMVLTKIANLESDGTYTITLEAFATGTTTVTETTESVPMDFILVLDQSGSMDDNLVSYTYSARSSQAYSYNVYGSRNTYYYKDGDNYYEVKRGNDSSGSWYNPTYSYYLYYEKDGATYYLSGTDVTTTKPSVTSNTTTIWTGVLYTRSEVNGGSKLDALKTAATKFVNAVYQDAQTAEVNHRMAIVGFASNSRRDWSNTELLSTNEAVNYTDAEETDYQDALVSVNSNGAVNTRLTNAVSRLDASGDTHPEYGFEMANNIFNQYDIAEGDNRKRVVVMFTDGYPAPYGTDAFTYDQADTVISQAYTTKHTWNATVYSVAVVSGVNPEADINTGFTYDGDSDAQQLVAMNRYMHYTSSNFKNATNLSGSFTRDASKYYFAASDEASLTDVFDSITKDAIESGTTVTLTESAVMRDIMTPDVFQLPEGYNAGSQITVKTQAVTTTDDSTYTDGAVTKYTYDSSTGKFVSGENTITVTANTETDTIDVTGFDYADNYVSKAHPGNKIIITISGVEATEAAATGETVLTNAATSGIYDGENMVTPIVTFPTPDAIIHNKSYVLDYAKPFGIDASSDWGSTGVSHLATSMAKFSTSATELDLTNGKVSASGTTLTYTPQTMSWNGYDKFFSFGTQEGGTTESPIYQWSKVNVIPANNVYYEDDFIAAGSTTDTAADDVVGIEYGDNWNIATATGSNTESANGTIHGWVDSLSDDTTHSDGFAASSSTPGATATFTFTGTGVDIYSYTDINSGVVIASLYKDGQTVANKTLIVDNLAVSGAYYQIPTLSFGPTTTITVKNEDGTTATESMGYGTYTVKLTVTSGKAVESIDPETGIEYSDTAKRSTYYLDGIRIYNPLGETVTDDTVVDAYDPDDSVTVTDPETNVKPDIKSVFKEVNELLAASDTTTDENAAFIDLLYTKQAFEVTQNADGKWSYTKGETEYVINNETYETSTYDGEDGKRYIDVVVSSETAAKDYYTSDVYNTYGPKNEVYLAPGQSIVFAVDTDAAEYYIGLKSLTGASAPVNAAFTSGANQAVTTISHTTDLYYKVVPSDDGYITVSNVSDSGSDTAEDGATAPILAVTKLQMVGPATSTFTLRTVTSEEAVTYATAFRAMPTVEYTAEPEEEVPVEPETPEEPTDPEIPEEPTDPETPEEPTEPETPEEPTEPEIPDIDIEIENPKPQPEHKPERPNHKEALNKLVNNLFNKIFGWFGR